MGKEKSAISVETIINFKSAQIDQAAINGRLNKDGVAQYIGFENFRACDQEAAMLINLLLPGKDTTISAAELKSRTAAALTKADNHPHDGKLSSQELDSFDPLVMPKLQSSSKKR